jgi:hypothetical protein
VFLKAHNSDKIRHIKGPAELESKKQQGRDMTFRLLFLFLLVSFQLDGQQASGSLKKRTLPVKEVSPLKKLCESKIVEELTLDRPRLSHDVIIDRLQLPEELRTPILQETIDHLGNMSQLRRIQSFNAIFHEKNSIENRCYLLMSLFNAPNIPLDDKQEIITSLQAEGFLAQLQQTKTDGAIIGLFKKLFDKDLEIENIQDYLIHISFYGSRPFLDLEVRGGYSVIPFITKKDEDEILQNLSDPFDLLLNKAPLLRVGACDEPLLCILLMKKDLQLTMDSFVMLLRHAAHTNNQELFSYLCSRYKEVRVTNVELSAEARQQCERVKLIGFTNCISECTPFFTSGFGFDLPKWGPSLIQAGLSVNTLVMENDDYKPSPVLGSALAGAADNEDHENIRWLLKQGAIIDLYAIEQALGNIFLYPQRTNIRKSNFELILHHLFKRCNKSSKKVNEFLGLSNIAMLVTILVAGVNRIKNLPQHLLNKQYTIDVSKFTLLMLAAGLNYTNLVRALLKRKVNPFIESEGEEDTPKTALHYACQNRHPQTVATLLEHGPISGYMQCTTSFDDYTEDKAIRRLLMQAGLLHVPLKRCASYGDLLAQLKKSPTASDYDSGADSDTELDYSDTPN